ncbi:helix-turn-helix domain-containing protein [Xenorhabdus bovienii]|uniref:Gp48 n=1 Tax=Xenorhabdus bovienii str. Intermedium TaxID=1379677 RepID=A0A077QH28_XENBV|nr:helix-turn-helix transcriptional regulator [Xenorhabdus bovienii]MDE1476156.1 helix-turn-helix transcriptional regulator [Xenorhabdus bovienii]MDE9455112.1 helix-turn-helix transcriptional regulator [Xenorhabdus bovienii]MDE9462294.1 helix-turn-helix transcriptional regulator [Xenorhabdus bovienii]MDE9469116.1 helix-turn-helix transcriptional regulator [Xenorhabdus bovienii]MDE9483305.1 helix-turn-helix transcriptional regulator [Xenorhabdus bovienii]
MNGISFEQLREELLDTPAAIQAYNDADQELVIVEMLYQMRERAGLSKSELAKKLGISPSAITRLEGNPLGASVKTLSRYASACGANIDIRMTY